MIVWCLDKRAGPQIAFQGHIWPWPKWDPREMAGIEHKGPHMPGTLTQPSSVMSLGHPVTLGWPFAHQNKQVHPSPEGLNKHSLLAPLEFLSKGSWVSLRICISSSFSWVLLLPSGVPFE